jgi:hypothetical protein
MTDQPFLFPPEDFPEIISAEVINLVLWKQATEMAEPPEFPRRQIYDQLVHVTRNPEIPF